MIPCLAIKEKEPGILCKETCSMDFLSQESCQCNFLICGNGILGKLTKTFWVQKQSLSVKKQTNCQPMLALMPRQKVNMLFIILLTLIIIIIIFRIIVIIIIIISITISSNLIGR